VDRCALFVDASYVLADGAMAVHGTRRGESVSWDYEGLVRLLSGLAAERSGLPVLRCYWYEATVDGRRTAEQDALADLPGIKLRVAKIRPGRREGVETEIHRDLTTLARNNAISDALVVSSEEDLAQVIADVQDLGLRVTLLHITVDGNWTISRVLRQESDDIIEVGGEQLRPYVELIAGAEPARPESIRPESIRPESIRAGEPEDARPIANGHSTAVGVAYQPLPAVANHAPPAIYTAPVTAEYQRPSQQVPRPVARETAREPRESREALRETREVREVREVREPRESREALRDTREVREVREVRESREPRELREARDDRPREDRPRDDRPRPDQPVLPSLVSRVRPAEEPSGYLQGDMVPSDPAPTPPGQLRRLPSRPPAGPAPIGPMGGAGPSSGPGSAGLGGQGSPRSAPYSGPQPVATPSAAPGYQSVGQSVGGVSLAEAVQAAHEEGQEFGGSVARDAPALWLEAVLARKPRMPSDLEARLLQGSALPIDFLLHDEVRHALRRGFWDALERTRR
jgi:hypothetical protein